MHTPDESPVKDFFISYNSVDRLWAEWIAWQLEEAGYSVVLSSWDFQPGQNFVQSMHEAISNTKQTIAVLSPDYLDDLYTEAEWTAAFTTDPKDGHRFLLPIQVRECREKLKGVLSLIVYIDLVGLDEHAARETLLEGVGHIRSKAAAPPNFPADKAGQPGFPARFPPIWNVPERNSFFTDREEILVQLHTALSMSRRAHILSQAINGLGGIGKTQIAIEYAYRYRHDYQTVLWMPADSHNTLIKSCLEVAHRLDLPQKDAQDQSEVMAAVQKWLQDHVNWLLIFDNADDLSIVREFLPSVARGHVLISTRAQAMGRIAQGNSVDTMTPEEGALFLLRRARILEPGDMLDDSHSAYQNAINMARMMDGLPLALDQAGAYIEEAGCTVANYQNLYKTHRKELLQRRGSPNFDHPEPVATTWSLSFRRVQEANPAAAELLKLCAFLSPDEIPEEIIIEGTAELDSELGSLANNPLEIDDAIAELRKYSLIQRHPSTKTFSIHRLVQTVLRDTMSEEEQRQWARRAIYAVNRVFPKVKFETWEQCQRYLPHARKCEKLITHWHMEFQEAAHLLHRAGVYLRERAHYADAEKMLQQALIIYKRIFGLNAYPLAHAQSDLATLYVDQRKYAQAKQLYLQALPIMERTQEVKPLELLSILNNLAMLCLMLGEHSQSASIIEHILVISEEIPAANLLDAVISLNNLASFYRTRKKYEQAESLYQRALSIREQALGLDHPDIVFSLDSLADLYLHQEKYEQAEPLYQRALSIREQALGLDHPDIVFSLDSLADLYLHQEKYEQAEPLYQRALSIHEQTFGLNSFFRAISLYNLAFLYQKERKYDQAEPLYTHALDICEQFPEVLSSITKDILKCLVTLLRKTQRPDEAAELERRIEEIQNDDIDENPEQ